MTAVLEPVPLTPATGEVQAVSLTLPVRRRWPSIPAPPLWALAGGALLLVASAVFSARVADSDSGYDLVGLLRAVGADLVRLRWQFTALVLVLAALHYAATALATRAAAGLRLPLAETILVQLAAAAANRISAAGVGAAAINARYFTRRGLPAASAIGAVAALAVLGALADLLVLGLIVLVGPWVGLSGVSHEITVVASRLGGLVTPLLSWWTWLLVAGILGVAVLLRRRFAARLAGSARRVWAPVACLLRRPRRLAVLLAASGATTLILAFAFVASVAMVPGPSAHLGTGALLVGFMFGAGASNAVPAPAGIGSTETALIAVLVTSGIPAAHAVETVILYRIVTFWLPPMLGLLATRRLHRLGAL